MKEREQATLIRDSLAQRAKRVAVELEEIVEEIESESADHPTFWTAFDVQRTTLDLKTAAVHVVSVSEKLKQVGSWKKT